jgi:hypothetical protein
VFEVDRNLKIQLKVAIPVKKGAKYEIACLNDGSHVSRLLDLLPETARFDCKFSWLVIASVILTLGRMTEITQANLISN